MAEELDVNLVALHVGSNHVLNAIGEAAMAFLGHEDGLAGRRTGLGRLLAAGVSRTHRTVEARHAHHKLQVGGLGLHVAEAMVDYAATEDRSAGALRSVRG